MPSLAAKLTGFLLACVLFFTVTPTFASGNLIAEINQFRASKGLAPVKTNTLTCSFASVRAGEIMNNFSHSGFYNRVNSKTMPYHYRLITENLAWAPGGQDPVAMWINSPSHAANMLKNTPFVCVEQSGDYFAYEGLSI